MTTIRRRTRGRPRHQTVEIRVRVAPVPPEDVVIVHGLRVTSPIRTLIDLAGELAPAEALRVTRQAIDKGLVSMDELRRAAEARTDLESIESFRRVMRDLEQA